jgi:hypothetical protein
MEDSPSKLNASAKEFVPKMKASFPFVPIVCVSNVPPPFFPGQPLINPEEYIEDTDDAMEEEKDREEFIPSNSLYNNRNT